MLPLLGHLFLPWIHKNGKEQETQTSKKADPLEEIPLIEVVEQDGEGESPPHDLKEFLAVPEFGIREVPSSQDPQFQFADIAQIEEFVRGHARITEAQASLKTHKDRTRHLQIRILVNQKMRSKQFRKLKQRLIIVVGARIDPKIEVEVFRLKGIPRNDTNGPLS